MDLPAFIDVIAALQTVFVISTRRPLPPKTQEFRLIQTKQSGFPYYSGFRKRKARVRKCNRFPREKGAHGPRRFMRRLRKLWMRIRQPLLSML